MMLGEHHSYLADGTRTDLFRKAVERIVKPGDTVADLGCGTGILGLLCLRAGAAHAYEIDETTILEAARESFARAGLDGKATFIAEKASRAELPGKVDLLICDHVGYFGVDYGLLPLLQDARRRFLKPGGRIIPSALRLKVAAVSSEAASRLTRRWSEPAIPSEFHWLSDLEVHRKHAMRLEASELISDRVQVASLDLAMDAPQHLSLAADLVAQKAGPLHGIAGWFEADLAPGVTMTNRPGDPAGIERPQAFFPIGQEVMLRAGEHLSLRMALRPGDDAISWSVDIPDQGVRFRHSTVKGVVQDAAWARRLDPDYKPAATATAQARSAILSYCDGTRSVAEIAEAARKHSPALSPSAEETDRMVAQVIAADTE